MPHEDVTIRIMQDLAMCHHGTQASDVYMCKHIITVVNLCTPSPTLKITSAHSLKSRNGDGAPAV